MGVAWAAVWAPIGVLIGLIVDSDGSMDEMWVAVGGYPGFLCGVVFSAVLGISSGRRRFDELSLLRVGTWGAASGVLAGAFPFVLLAADQSGALSGWLRGALLVTSMALLSAISAAGSQKLAKVWRRRNAPTPVET